VLLIVLKQLKKLQQQINVVEKFCNNTGMEANLDMIELIVFCNYGHLRSKKV
jgi:hypothetical protein